MSKITVIHHSADFDGLFCREIAKKFLPPETEFIGWDFADTPLSPARFTIGQKIYIMDLPIDRVFGFTFGSGAMEALMNNVIWIDHHKSSIETHPTDIPGYRIDGVAACRLAWQWFFVHQHNAQNATNEAFQIPLPQKQDFIERVVFEPYAVQLAGEYDIWDHRNPDAKVFQFGLRSRELTPFAWGELLNPVAKKISLVDELLSAGHLLIRYQRETDAAIVAKLGFVVEFEGLKFLALNTTARNSQAFEAKDVPETGHDALMKFNFTGEKWDVSLYHARHNTGIDLSSIAVKHGGGGHRGAAGFRAPSLPFVK